MSLASDNEASSNYESHDDGRTLSPQPSIPWLPLDFYSCVFLQMSETMSSSIPIHNVSPHIMQLILDFVYGMHSQTFWKLQIIM